MSCYLTRFRNVNCSSSDEEKYLRKLKLIEGRKPNFYLSLGIVEKMDEKANYTKNKAFDKQLLSIYIHDSGADM